MLHVYRLHKALLAGLCVLACCPWGRAQEKIGENEMKAAYVFNFIQFIEWPQGDGRAGSDWTICVSPFSPLKRTLLALEGRPARKDNHIRIRLWEANELDDCRVLVLHGADTDRALRALRAAPGKTAVLTIADEPATAPAEIMITLHREGDRIVFDINADAIGKAGLSVSSRLLRLSRGPMNFDSPASADSAQLSSRVVATGLLATGLALLTMVLALTAFDYWSSRQAMLADSRVEAAIVADNVSTAVMFRDAHTTEEMLGALRASPMVLMAGIYDAQGVLLASYQRDGDQVAPGTLPGGGNGDFEYQGLYLLEMAKPVKFRGKSSGSIYLRKSMAEVYTHLVIRFGGALLIAGGTMALATALVLRSRAAVGEAERRLQVLAHQDAVTGVGNRHFFNERLAHEIDRAATLGSKLALVYIDLDNFKALNDTFGHAAGDGLLRQVAQRLQSVVRAEDDICRMGGDEFSVILRLDMDEAALSSYAGRIVAVFEKGFVESDQEVMVTCSAGIATYPGDAPDRDSLISSADTAMYRAKDLGKNRCERFDASMNLAAVRRHAIEKALRQVLEDGQGLALHYQPVFSAGDQKMIGAEALLRWSHDKLGNIPPLEAVMVAEECGLIVHLGYWVVRTACRDAARWQAQSQDPLRVAVNVSARQLNDPQFLERVMDILREEGLPAHLLEIELTETVLMENMDACASTLHRLSQLGVHLAIDDFGTGYSSLAYLRRLPMKRLKIDRSFIRDLPEQEHSRMIVKAIIALSHGLGLAVTAEGVETQAQIDYLVGAGCDVLQGFAFARPMPVEQFEAMQAAR